MNNAAPSSRIGWMPWIVWALAAAFYCYGFFHRVAPSVMINELMRDFAVSAVVLGNLSAFYFYAYAGLQLPVGVLIDRFGARWALALAAVLCGIGSLLFAYAETITMAYVGRLLIGAGAGFTWVGTLKLAADWFPPRRFALISGMTLALGMCGAIFGQAPLSSLVDAYGWRGSLAGAAIFVFVLGAAIFIVVRDGGPDGRPPRPVGPNKVGLLSGLVSAMRTPQSWIIAVFGGAMTAPMLAFAGLWGVPYFMARYDVERGVAAGSMSLVLAGWAVGAPLLGALSDRIGRRKLPMVVGSLVSVSLFAMIVYMPGLPLWLAQGMLFVQGVASSAMIIAFAAGREHNHPETAGAALGFVNTAVMASGAIFQPLIGALLDWNWDGALLGGGPIYSVQTFQMALSCLIVMGVIGLIAAFFFRETRCRNVYGDLK